MCDVYMHVRIYYLSFYFILFFNSWEVMGVVEEVVPQEVELRVAAETELRS